MTAVQDTYICFFCGHVVEDELPTFREGHRIGDGIYYEPPREDRGCPVCHEIDALVDAVECRECGHILNKEEAEQDWRTNEWFCPECYNKTHPEECEDK